MNQHKNNLTKNQNREEKIYKCHKMNNEVFL